MAAVVVVVVVAAAVAAVAAAAAAEVSNPDLIWICVSSFRAQGLPSLSWEGIFVMVMALIQYKDDVLPV